MYNSNIFAKISSQNNSRQEWAFQKAVTILTYCNYHPIPVPFNIISTLASCCYGFRKKKAAVTLTEANRKFRQKAWVSLWLRQLNFTQLRPQGLLFVQNDGSEKPLLRLPKWLQRFVRIVSHKHDKMSSFCLNNSFRL